MLAIFCRSLPSGPWTITQGHPEGIMYALQMTKGQIQWKDRSSVPPDWPPLPLPYQFICFPPVRQGNSSGGDLEGGPSQCGPRDSQHRRKKMRVWTSCCLRLPRLAQSHCESPLSYKQVWFGLLWQWKPSLGSYVSLNLSLLGVKTLNVSEQHSDTRQAGLQPRAGLMP